MKRLFFFLILFLPFAAGAQCGQIERGYYQDSENYYLSFDIALLGLDCCELPATIAHGDYPNGYTPGAAPRRRVFLFLCCDGTTATYYLPKVSELRRRAAPENRRLNQYRKQ